MSRRDASHDRQFERPFFAEMSRLDQVDYLQASVSVGGIAVGHYRSVGTTLEVGAPNALMPVHYLPVMLLDIPAQHAWRDGRHRLHPALPTGALVCYDLRHRWETELCFPFHTVNFYVPQQAFDVLTEEMGRPPIETLCCLPSQATVDPIVLHLARSLASLMDAGHPISSLLADHILSAVRFHVAVRYGGLRVPVQPAVRLSAVQVGALKALMLDDLARDVRLAELAQSCSLSVRAFERAFRRTFGTSPHQWRLAAKVERSRRMIELTDRPLGEIALRCGFYDQSHLTRVFSRHVGVSPGAYRGSRRN